MADYIAQLQNYWLKLAADDANIDDLADAQDAMLYLVGEARTVPYVRQQFAQANIFEDALSKDLGSDTLVQLRSDMFGFIGQGDVETRPPRQIMLDSIREASIGALFFPAVAGGVAPWISSVDSSVRAIAKTLTDDHNDVVRSAAMKFVREVPIPVAWGQYLAQNQIFDIVARSAVGAQLDAAAREALQTLANQAKGEILINLAQSVSLVPTGGVSLVPTGGTGEQVPVMKPGKPVPWWRTPGIGIYFVGGAGALLGALYRRRQLRQ
jgi:hypothetical protein